MWKRDRYHVVDEDENLVAVAWNEGLAEQIVANHNALLRAEQHVAAGTIAIGEDQLDAAANSDAPRQPSLRGVVLADVCPTCRFQPTCLCPARRTDAPENPPQAEAEDNGEERCPSCGYTAEDARTLMDHHLCPNHGRAPFDAPENPPQAEADGLLVIISSGMRCSRWVESFKIKYHLTEQALALASDCIAVDDRLKAVYQQIYQSLLTHVSALGRACAEVAAEQPQPTEGPNR